MSDETNISRTAEEMRNKANNENSKKIDNKKEIDVTVTKILKSVETMAELGDYRTSYLCNNKESEVIDDVIKELNELGYKTTVTDFGGTARKAIAIEWS